MTQPDDSLEDVLTDLQRLVGELTAVVDALPTEHDPVAVGDESLEDKVNRINKELTKRINDLRSDFVKQSKTVTDTVKKVTDAVEALQTAVDNNKASIEAQDALIESNRTKADSASQAAASAQRTADTVQADLLKARQEFESGLAEVGTRISSLHAEYQEHTHEMAPPGGKETA